MLIIEPPINDKWMLFNPPGTPEKRYHFVRLNRQGKMYSPFSGVNHLFFATAGSNFMSYGEEVFSPENAVVKEVVGDRSNKFRFNFFLDLLGKSKVDVYDKNTWGNYVILEVSGGKHLVLKNLLSVSEIVAGQQVEKGTLVGKVGCSGACHLPGLGLLCFADQNLDQLQRIAFVNVIDKQGNTHDLFYPIQSKSFRKKGQENQENS